MNDVSGALAKLAGIRKSINAALNEDISRRPGQGAIMRASTFNEESAKNYFVSAALQLKILADSLPGLFGDFDVIRCTPDILMSHSGAEDEIYHYSRQKMERLMRDIDQIFEIRANSELQHPVKTAENFRRVFVTHGRSSDWREVQTYIEKDIKLATMELAQEPSSGMTIIEKLIAGADKCDSAVIVMTGDDIDADGQARSRENVMHEIGFFQGKYGRSQVCLLHEDGVSIPTNLSGVVYIPYPKGMVSAGFYVLARELSVIYPK